MQKKRFSLVLLVVLLGQLFYGSGQVRAAEAEDGWEQVPQILNQIVPPSFPDRIFDITDYGAVGDGKTDATEAFRQAIEAANAAGGGRVVVPAGTYLTGAIHLKSNVNLHVTENAVVKFSQDPKKYLPVVLTRWEGIELYNYSPLIYAYGVENIAITGSGTLDGQGDNEHWWPWKGKKEYGWTEGQPNQEADRNRLIEMGEKNVPVEQRVFGDGHYLRPSFIQPYNSKNILIEGVTVLNSPMWQINPVLSENITIQNVKIIGHGPNNDGIDPESVKNMLIKDSYFDNGDDCIAIKSGRNADGRRINVPTENVVIQGNHMKDGHGGVTIGSEMSGGVRNIFAENNLMDSPNLERAIRFKTNWVRGGIIENVYVRDNEVKNLESEVLSIDMTYEEGMDGDYPPVVRNIELRNVTSNGGKYGVYIKAFEGSPVTNLRIIDSSFNNVKTPAVMEHVEGATFSRFFINGKLYDTLKPETQITIAGVTLSDGSYLGQAQVSLTASDDDEVERIEYRSTADSAWSTYTQPIVLTKEGENKLEFRAIDKAGNTEEAQLQLIVIKQATLPLLSAMIENLKTETPGIKQALSSQVQAVERDVSAGNKEQAYRKLENVLKYAEQHAGKQMEATAGEDLSKVIEAIVDQQSL
ncbi:hypothetical protein GCM10023228_18030 [Brevibacillus fulvus]|uniref:Polygalacturonase n=1 Tax=Brevibacillus fulvus TaxID=1125967 RepID=A0A939BWE7_9BACL|nr:polygalacturonase [Brevibacillus fulvus]